MGSHLRNTDFNFINDIDSQDVAIPVGPKVSLHTAEALERNIENELKENVGRPRVME